MITWTGEWIEYRRQIEAELVRLNIPYSYIDDTTVLKALLEKVEQCPEQN